MSVAYIIKLHKLKIVKRPEIIVFFHLFLYSTDLFQIYKEMIDKNINMIVI